MTEQVSQTELQALRDRVAELEAARDQPQAVEIKGFDGLRELSRAIETKNLDTFMADRGMPDWAFWSVLGIVLACLIVPFFLAFEF